MSYTAINGMRSTRYPLQGLGACSCASRPPVGAVADDKTGKALKTTLAVTIGLTVGYFIWGR